MLKTFVPAEDEYDSFTRPAVYDSIKRVLKFYSLEDTSKIYYNGENEIAKLVGSNATDDRLLDIHTDGVFGNKLFVVSETTDTEFNNGYANQRRQPTERPVWMSDGAIPIAIYPGFVGTKVEVSINAVFNSLKHAQQFRKRVERQQANQMVDFSFNPTVHLGLNNSILEMLEDFHTLYVKNDPTTPTLGNWFDKYCKTPFTTIMNAKGNHKRIVAPMKLTDVGIIFSEPQLQRTRKGSTYGRFEVELKYHFYLNAFSHWELEYPLNVYQDEIPARWIPRPQETFTQNPDVRVSQETAYGNITTTNRKVQAPFYLKLPNHDPWTMPKQDWFQPVVQARLKVQALPEQVIVNNIFNIPGFTWSEEVKEYILSNKENAFNRHRTLFPIFFFSNDVIVNPSDLVMNEDGSITLKYLPVMENTYRVVVGVDLGIRSYTEEFWDNVKEKPEQLEVIEKIFNWYDWEALKKPDVGNTTGGTNNVTNPVGVGTDKGTIAFDNLIYKVTKEIKLGHGLLYPTTNRYQANMDLYGYRILEGNK